MIPETKIIFATDQSDNQCKKIHLAKVNINFILAKMSIINTRLPYTCHKMS